MRPLLVGEASNAPGGVAFAGASGRRLAMLAGMSPEEFLAAFEAVNLLRRWPGRSAGAKGHEFPLGRARRAARRLDVRGRCVVLAGKRVALAFGLRDVEFLRPVELGRDEASCVVLPHPSGIVRWYNSRENGRRVGRLLRRLAKECTCGQ